MFTAETILDKINAYLERIPEGRTPQSLYQPIQYVLSIGGKRIRPTLMPTYAEVSPLFINDGMLTRPFFPAIRCWCSRTFI